MNAFTAYIYAQLIHKTHLLLDFCQLKTRPVAYLSARINCCGFHSMPVRN